MGKEEFNSLVKKTIKYDFWGCMCEESATVTFHEDSLLAYYEFEDESGQEWSIPMKIDIYGGLVIDMQDGDNLKANMEGVLYYLWIEAKDRLKLNT